MECDKILKSERKVNFSDFCHYEAQKLSRVIFRKIDIVFSKCSFWGPLNPKCGFEIGPVTTSYGAQTIEAFSTK